MQYFLSKKCSRLSPFAFRLIAFRLNCLSPYRLIASSPYRLIALSPFASRLSPLAFVGYSAQKTVYHSEVLK